MVRPSTAAPEAGSAISARAPTQVKNYPDQLQKTGDGLFAGPLAGAVKSVGDCGSLPGGAGALVTTPIGQMPCNFPLTFTGTFAQTLPRDGTQYFVRMDYNPSE